MNINDMFETNEGITRSYKLYKFRCCWSNIAVLPTYLAEGPELVEYIRITSFRGSLWELAIHNRKHNDSVIGLNRVGKFPGEQFL